MRTNIDLDDRLLKKAMKLLGSKTKRETVQMALQRLVDTVAAERRQQERSREAARGLMGLRGMGWDDDLQESRRDRVIEIDPPGLPRR